jgi:hypothetical protein
VLCAVCVKGDLRLSLYQLFSRLIVRVSDPEKKMIGGGYLLRGHLYLTRMIKVSVQMMRPRMLMKSSFPAFGRVKDESMYNGDVPMWPYTTPSDW